MKFTQPDTQTKLRGSHSDEYEIYVACAQSIGWEVKSYDEWMGS